MQTRNNNNQKKKDSRVLKINRKSYPDGNWFKDYSEIRLSGLWLTKLGFAPDGRVNVITKEKELTLIFLE